MENIKKIIIKESEVKRFGLAIFGTFLFAFGMNIFIVPLSLYSGGAMGISQVIRTILVDYLSFPIKGFDISGGIYYLINIPLFFIAYKYMGKKFFVRTLVCVTTTSLFLSLISVPKNPILADDVLASCIIGGIICGFGLGFTLRMGGSSGGLDIVGLFLIKKNKNYSIGQITLIVNLILYLVCFFLFDEKIVIYSMIFASISAFGMDKAYIQNINVQVKIITKKPVEDMEHKIMHEIMRGITRWEAKGGYTGKDVNILFVVLSKYEVSQLKRIVEEYDEEAFIVVSEGTNIQGNYLKKL